MLLVTFTTVQRMTSQFSCQNVALDLLRPRLGIRPLELSTMLTPFCPLSWLRGFPEKFPKQRSLLFECYCLSLLFLFPSSRRCFIPFSPWFHFFSWKWLNSTFIFILSIHVFLDILIERNALSYSRIRIEINISIGNSQFPLEIRFAEQTEKSLRKKMAELQNGRRRIVNEDPKILPPKFPNQKWGHPLESAYLNLPAQTVSTELGRSSAFPFSLPKWTLIFPINLDVTTCNSRYTRAQLHTRAPFSSLPLFHLPPARFTITISSPPSTCPSPCSSFSLACRRARHLFISIIIPVDGGGIS